MVENIVVGLEVLNDFSVDIYFGLGDVWMIGCEVFGEDWFE